MTIQEITFLCSIVLFVIPLLYFILFFKKENEEKKKIKTLQQIIEEQTKQVQERSKKTIYINKLTNKKLSFFYRILQKIHAAVYSEYSDYSMRMYIIMTVSCVLFGIYLSRIFQNPMVSILFFFVFSVLPYFFVSYSNNKKRSMRDKKLQMVMGNLSISYIRTKTFLEAVEQTIDIIPEGLKGKFEFYYRNVMYFHADPIAAMYELKNSIENEYFEKMMNLAINAELGEKELKYTILSIPVDYKRYIDINDNFARQVKSSNIGFITVLCCFPLVVSFLKIASGYYFHILTETTVGKISVFLVILSLIGISMLFLKFNKPVKMKL